MIAEYFRAVRRQWVAGVVVLVLAVLAALGYSMSQKPSYTATAELYVSMDKVQSVSDLSTGAAYVLGQMKSFESVVVSPAVTQPVINQLKLSDSTSDLASRIQVTTTTDSTIMDISCTATNAQESADICNQVAAQFQKRVPSLATFQVANRGTLKADLLTPATPPALSANPSKSLLLGAGAFVGLLLGLVACVLVDRARSGHGQRRLAPGGATTAADR